jgi:predicted TPR repeat methyltransferase
MKSKYVMPRTDVLPCRVGHLLGESQLPFDPTDGTGEALAKQFDDRLENNIVTELHYELGQKEGNWFDNLDKWKEY